MRQRDHLSQALRCQRAIELALRDVKLARDQFALAIMNLHDESGLSYASISRLFGVTRARIQQLVEYGRTIETT